MSSEQLFARLIQELHQKTGQQVVVLVDEYDKPIIDNSTDADKAAELREGLRNIYYCSIVCCYFAGLGLQVQPKDVTNHGRIDLTVCFAERVYIFAFKVNELTEPVCALAQIKEKNYAEKYQQQDKKMWLISIEFNRTERNISRLEWEQP